MLSKRLGIFITSALLLCSALTVRATGEEEDSKEEISQQGGSSSINSVKVPVPPNHLHNLNHHKSAGVTKGDTTVPSRYTSSRAYIDDRKRDGHRYYGTGSKSGNSFLPTNIHKSTSSLDSHNYFVTTKTNLKDMDAAGSGMAGGGSDGNYNLQVYESPPMMNSMNSHGGGGGGGGSGLLGGGGGGGGGGNPSMMGMDEQFGDMASETGHGWGHSGGGYGGSGGGGKGCNSALGLLGVLGLAAYLQNVLRNMQNGTAGRRRRDVSFDSFDHEAKLETVRTGMAQLDLNFLPLNETSKDMKLDEKTYKQVMRDVFPLLSAVAHARDGLIPVHCTHSSVCLANNVLVKDLGYLGHSIGIRITNAISKLLTRITKDERAEQIRMISKAGKMGRNSRNCLKVFPTCNRLRNLPTYNIPSILENHDVNHKSSSDKSIKAKQ